MFNLFGSLFFGRQATATTAAAAATVPQQEREQENNENVEQQLNTQALRPTTTGANMDACTQTASSSNDQLLMVSHHDNEDAIQKQWVIVERAKQQQAVSTSTTHLLDDVREEEEPHREEEMPAQNDHEHLPKNDDNEDVLLGSFFDRQARETTPVEVASKLPQTQKADEWLITPLPCLTSITCSQRSIESDPLENLLIEHPSMSVFVTVTSSVLAVSSADADELLNKQPNFENASKADVPPPSQQMMSQKKRKGMELSPSQQQQHQQQQPAISPSSTMRRSKASKRNKKSSAVSSSSQQQPQSTPVSSPVCSPASANKENAVAVKMLTSEFRSKANPAAKLDSILLNKNQMKRNNKHAFKFNSNNCIQRKFHKLQQPVCC